MMAAAAAAHRPPKNKYLGTQEGVMYPPPPNKKAKFSHHHGDDNNNHHNSSSAGAHNNEENNNNDHRHMSSSPTDVLTHPTAAAAPSTSTVAANNTNGIFSAAAAAVVKTLPPSLKGIAEAAKGLNSSLRNIHNSRSSAVHLQQKSSPQLVAFPTEALYVLTCCVKTTSKKKILLANTAAVAASSRNQNESAASSTLIGSSCSYGDIHHPSNPSLDHLLSRQTPIIHHQQQEGNLSSSTPSVFVIDNKHAQHYCQFSAPKIFAIRPKQQSRSDDLMADDPSSISSSLLMAGTNNSNGVESKMNHHPLKQEEEQELGLGCTNNNTSYSPSSSPRIQKSSLPLSSSSISSTGEPTPECGAMIASTSSSSLYFPMTPKATADNATPSSSSSVATVSPIIANNVAIAHMNDAKMPPSLPLSSHSRPSINHGSNNNSKLGTSKILAANFSESYEAFSRLTNKFWPGPMIIYAPARMIRVGNTTTGCTDLSSSSLQKSSHNNWPRSSSTESSSSSSSCPSLPSFTNLYSLEKGEGAAGNNMDSQEVPVLPPSILIPLRDLLPGENNNTNNEEQFFIGMQCPSHPLARKILTEIYQQRRGSITSTSASLPMTHSTSIESFASFSSLDTSITFPHYRQGKQQQHVRCGVAVVGSYVAPLLTDGSSSSGGSSTTVVANSATNVTKILSSSTSSNNSNVNRAAEQIYVVNGEDTTHENFSVPTCNYGGVSPISLVVDGDNRTIHLLRHHQNGHDVSGGCNNIHTDKIYRALLQPPSSLRSTTAVNVDNCSNNKASSAREIDRVITAVLSRWKVVEHHV
ncbi:hypothetical protein QTG54_006230 [Skeletonema marinoi]|uniref:Uncharacterized protein n=1 Tax=Skeletonema marinoi TaxID=267567 RepID=A0AAD9DEE7_9STRA|nr:hypothetical protein QTG54_006230 [Skeletonema marinoi]